MADPLPAVPLPGIRPDSLGRYLAALGLLRVATRKWPQVRGAWRDGYFWLVGGPAHLDRFVDHVWDMGACNHWAPYDREWKQGRDDEDEKKRKLGDPSPLSLHQAGSGELAALLSTAHSVATEISPLAKSKSAWRFDNPLLGYGGFVGQRDYAEGWRQAKDEILLRQMKDEVEKKQQNLQERREKKKADLQDKEKRRQQPTKGEETLATAVASIKQQIEALEREAEGSGSKEKARQKKLATLNKRLQKKQSALHEKQHKRSRPTEGEEKLAAELASFEQQCQGLAESVESRTALLKTDLIAVLRGNACQCLGSWNAASWFSEANKVANCGQDWFGGGQVTPWAMLLACEGIPFFAGSPSRRLGSRARSVGGFPFVTRPAAPERPNEAGRDRAEVWLPVWHRPMTAAEVRMLFLRGRAEVGGAGATTPAAFAAAVVRRGVDAGIDGFQRFVLGRTTTDQVFESRLEGFVPLPGVRSGEVELARAGAIESILALCDRLPRDRRKGKRWQFYGLRGPVEVALVDFAAAPEDPERATRLLDAVVTALDKVDRNRNHRKAGVRWRPLPIGWLPALFGDMLPPLEARLAMGLASTGSEDEAMLVHRYGVRFDRYRREFTFPESAPPRCTWGNRPLKTNLALILRRRLVDADPAARLPLWAAVRTTAGDLSEWLAERADDREVERWLSRLVLFDWRNAPEDLRRFARGEQEPSSSAMLALHAVLRPLFEPRHLWLERHVELLPPNTHARSVPAGRQVVSLLAARDVPGAVRVARSRYHMACQPLARINVSLSVTDPERLLASLLIPTAPGELVRLTRAWLRPTRQKGIA